MSKKKKKKQSRQRPELGFIGLLLALLGLSIVATYLSDSRGDNFGFTLTLLWLYAGGAAFTLGVMYFAQFIAPVRGNFGWLEGLFLIFRSYWQTTQSFLDNPRGQVPRRSSSKKEQADTLEVPQSLKTLRAGFLHSYHVLSIMKAGTFTRPAGPGFVKLHQKENVRQVIDLRTQVRTQPVQFNTRDGIPLESAVTVIFQVRQSPADFDDDFLYPYDREAIFKLSYLNTIDKDGHKLAWTDQLTPRAAALLTQELAQYDLDSLINFPEASGSPVGPVTQRILNMLKPEFDEKGITVFRVMTAGLTLPDEVKEQNIATWRAGWEGRIQMEAASSEAEIIRRTKQARARAQMQIIETIIQNLEAMRKEGESDTYQVIILRLIDALEEAMSSDSPRAIVPQQIMASLVADTSAQVRSQLDEYFLVSGGRPEPVEDVDVEDAAEEEEASP